MAVEVDTTRKAYVISYDVEKVEGDKIEATFENDSDVSVYKGANDGGFVVTRPAGADPVTDTVTVKGSDGGEDTGEVTLD